MHPDVKAALSKIGASRPGATPASIQIPSLPHAELSYALAGEDMALRRLLKQEVLGGGTYVDIGCFSPFTISNTMLFYNFGRRGLCVDADAQFAPQWAKFRPRDKFVHAAVGETPGMASVFRHKTNPGYDPHDPTGPNASG